MSSGSDSDSNEEEKYLLRKAQHEDCPLARKKTVDFLV